jgi:tRNA dimethylallyltransferase
MVADNAFPVPFLVVIAGPTASGKSALGVALARRLGGEIVNADSQQSYRGLAVGTGKPSEAERGGVPHHGFDLAAPGEGMDARRWLDFAAPAIEAIAARGHRPIVVGGTGLYLRALLHGVAAAPGRDPELRARLEAEAREKGRPHLHARLAAIDPRAAARIRENDLVRVIRAIEIAASGRTQSELFEAHRFAPDRYPHRLLALEVPRPELHRRIEARVEAMFAGGILEEARALLAAGLGGRKLPLGYAEALAVVREEMPVSQAIAAVQAAHRQYAKRQIIWLRKERGAQWIAPPDASALETLAAEIAGSN